MFKLIHVVIIFCLLTAAPTSGTTTISERNEKIVLLHKLKVKLRESKFISIESLSEDLA